MEAGYDSELEDDNLEQLVIEKQRAEMSVVESMSEEDIAAYANDIKVNMAKFLMNEKFKGCGDVKNMISRSIIDYEEEEDVDEYEAEKGDFYDFLGDMEQELTSILDSSNGQASVASESVCILDQLDAIPFSFSVSSPISSVANSSGRTYPLHCPLYSKQKDIQNEDTSATADTISTSTTTSSSPEPLLPSTQYLDDSYHYLSSLAATASFQVLSTASVASSYSSKVIKQAADAKEALISINNANEKEIREVENLRQKRYKALLSCTTAVEIIVPPRSCTKIPFLVPSGKDISWRFLVKDYDIGFSVSLREKVYVMKGDDDSAGGVVENVLIPFFKLSAYDKVEDNCCAEQTPRSFVFALDNTHSTFRSKSLVYDVTTTDAVMEESECESIARYEQSLSYEHEQQQGVVQQQHTQHNDEDQRQLQQWQLQKNCNSVEAELIKLDDDCIAEGHDEFGKCQSDSKLTAADIKNGWVAYYDEDRNLYYYNHVTEASQWENPSVVGDLGTSGLGDEEQLQEKHEAGGREYAYHDDIDEDSFDQHENSTLDNLVTLSSIAGTGHTSIGQQGCEDVECLSRSYS